MKEVCFSLIFLIFLTVSCGETTGVEPINKGLAGFTVEFADDFDLGSPEHRIENPEGGIVTKINITAIGYDKKPLTNYKGEIEISMLYGEIDMDNERPTMENGYLGNIDIKMKNCLDNDRVVVQEVKEHEGDSGHHEPTGKMGVSPVFYTQVATISAIQSMTKGDNGLSSVFNNRNLTLKDRQMVVIAVIEGGFYLHEVGAEDYSSIYMYTYSTPYVDDNREESMFLPVGTLIESANGSVFEFFGFTEMSFPTFKPVYVNKNGKKELKIDTSLIPAPKNINNILNNKNEMEKREASLVTVENVSVAWFNEDDSSYIEYSQFPLETSDGDTIMAQTLYTAPLFNAVAEKPADENSKGLHRYNFTGILKQHTSARPSTWILVPRDMNDIKCLDCK